MVFCFGGERGGAKGKKRREAKGRGGEVREGKVGYQRTPSWQKRRIVTGSDLT